MECFSMALLVLRCVQVKKATAKHTEWLVWMDGWTDGWTDGWMDMDPARPSDPCSIYFFFHFRCTVNIYIYIYISMLNAAVHGVGRLWCR